MTGKLLKLLGYWAASFVVFLTIGIIVAVISELEFSQLFSFPGILALLSLSAGSTFVAVTTTAPETERDR